MAEIKWRAWYSDGTYLDQISGQDQYTKIDRTRLNAFEIFSDDKSLLRVWLDDDKRKKLIYRRRVQQNFSTGAITSVVYLVGWHMKVGNESIQSINYIIEVPKTKTEKAYIKIEQAGKWVGRIPTLREDEK